MLKQKTLKRQLTLKQQNQTEAVDSVDDDIDNDELNEVEKCLRMVNNMTRIPSINANTTTPSTDSSAT